VAAALFCAHARAPLSMPRFAQKPSWSRFCVYILKKSMADIKKNHAVKFNQYGGVEVLTIQETLIPALGPTQVLVRVKAAGINIGEAKIREGAFARQWPTTFPSGQGSDFAGIIETISWQAMR
jgi:hypothetical protein